MFVVYEGFKSDGKKFPRFQNDDVENEEVMVITYDGNIYNVIDIDTINKIMALLN